MTSSNYSSNIMENSHFLSNTQKIQKAHYVALNNQSLHEDTNNAKSFLNSTLNASNYNSLATDSRNSQTYGAKASRNSAAQQTVIQHQSINAAKGMPPSQLTTSSHHVKQASMKTPTKPVTSYHNYSGSNAGSFAPVSASTDLGSFNEKREDGMRVYRGPFNVNCTTSREPQQVMYEMIRSLEIQKISYKKVNSR